LLKTIESTPPGRENMKLSKDPLFENFAHMPRQALRGRDRFEVFFYTDTNYRMVISDDDTNLVMTRVNCFGVWHESLATLTKPRK
jgi:hypothetical protein